MRRLSAVLVLGALCTGSLVVLAPAAGAATLPGTVRSLRAVGGEGTVVATWLPPSGSTPVDGYEVVGTGCGLAGTARGQVATSATFTGLPNRCRVTVSVFAHGAAGFGLGATTTAVTSDASNGAVRNLTARALDGAVRVHWTTPTSAGQSAPSSYAVTASVGTVLVSSVSTSTTTVDLIGLPTKKLVTITVVPANKVGVGMPNSVSVVPGVKLTNVTPTRVVEVHRKPVKLQIKFSAAFTGAPLAGDLVGVYARRGAKLVRVARILTDSHGVASYTARVLTPAQIVLRPMSNSVQGILFRISLR